MAIPLFRPLIDDDAIAAAVDVLRSGWLGLGPRTAEFEQAFAAYVGAPACVGVDSCTAALQLALRLAGVGPGDDVVTTALTFISTNHAILYEGAHPVFADVEPDTGCVDVTSVSDRLTPRTRAVMAVHYGGRPCDLDPLYALAREHGVTVIEDCAHATGVSYHGRRIGSHGDYHAFSFHPVKNLPMGSGGALTLRDRDAAARARRLRWLGIDRDTHSRSQGSYEWEYDVAEVGLKCHMTDVNAAIGLAQLRRLDRDNARRAEIATQYRERLRAVDGITLLREDTDRTSSNHLFVVLADGRDTLFHKLRANDISAGVHYTRNDTYAMYERVELPHTDAFSRRALSLPMHLLLTDDDVDRVCAVIAGGW